MLDDGYACPKEPILQQLADTITRRLGPQQGATVAAFARAFYAVSSPEELATSNPDDLYAACLSYWRLMQCYDPARPRVRVFNPDYEQQGWSSPHTLIQAHSADMPFLVRSIRMALDGRQLTIHRVNNCVLSVTRDGGGNLKRLGTAPEQDATSEEHESVISIEVDRQSDPDRLEALREQLLDVLAAVRAAVDDYPAMRKQAAAVRDELAAMPAADPAQRQEAMALLEWLLDRHFVFLAYRRTRGDGTLEASLGSEIADEARQQPSANLVQFSKDTTRSMVHRDKCRDLVIFQRLGFDGSFQGEHRFYGLYTSPVYTAPPQQIPVVRRKVADTLSASGFKPGGHSYKTLRQVLDELPRDELFFTSSDELKRSSQHIFNLQERRRVSLQLHPDPSGRFIRCLYYIHRDLYSTALRERVQQLLMEGLHGNAVEVSAQLSNSLLSRVLFTVYRDESASEAIDTGALEARILKVSRDWGDELRAHLVASLGEELGSQAANRFRGAFPSAYPEHFTTANAVCDIEHLQRLEGERDISLRFYRPVDPREGGLRFKLYSIAEYVILSDVVPILEQMGLRVLGAHPYKIRCPDGARFWISDFTVSHSRRADSDLQPVKPLLQEAFARIWHGDADNDPFNQLLIGAGLEWREVLMLRAYARYMKQVRFGLSQSFIADTLLRHPAITRQLVALFHSRFQPGHPGDASLESKLLDALEQVASLDDDRILRRFLLLIQASLRTNYYQTLPNGEAKPYLSFKLDPQAIPDIPQPRPRFEVFVYSPRVEGVHLRAGPVARGGIRWSERREDYRTEVLGLVKAQQVKNAVIVPVGAKGCFIAKQLPEGNDREAFQAEGVACYRLYIRGLLDLTDNLDGDVVVPPPQVVRHDGDDTYLVVAADKGTATFSDIANELSREYGFWLADAFASGGGEGYDHKKMGITARGAWESVKRHFRELGLDVQTDPHTVVAIGDMGGDVFGNGMLQSPATHLLAAFNHQHIFIDPQPDAGTAYRERQRLFALPRSSWADYDGRLISTGGGVFSRSAKWITISPQMQSVFDISAQRLAPTELITALLKAPVDMLWNGGIGTYVKASSEQHSDAGDKANDSLRIDGRELRCRVLGEGGNLGFTQLGRIEFATIGGAANTDFIDNAGGVDCSDHEVNVKILLNEEVNRGELTLKQRNRLLREMTDEVAALVLKNNYRQAQALHIAAIGASNALDDHRRLIQTLEQAGSLDRELEFLPTDDSLLERKRQGLGLTRPELSVLISYAKIELKQALVDSWITDDPDFSHELLGALPPRLHRRFPEATHRHRLRRELAATQIANDLVNRMGITFVHKLREATGADYPQIAAAYLIAREIFAIDRHWSAIEALDRQVPCATQVAMMKELIRLVTRSSHWLLRHRQDTLTLAACSERYREAIANLCASSESLAGVIPVDRWGGKYEEFRQGGAPVSLAAPCAAAESLYSLLDIIEASNVVRHTVPQVAAVYFALGEQLDLTWLDDQLRGFEPGSHWQALAAAGYRNDLDRQLQTLTLRVFQDADLVQQNQGEAFCAEALVKQWAEQQPDRINRWQRLLSDIQRTSPPDCAIFSVALDVLTELT